MTAKVRISGMAGLQNALKGLEGAISEAEARRMLLNAMEPVVAAAQRYAPVDQGDLRDSIEAVVENGPKGPTVSVGSSSPIAHLVEFGTGGHAQGGQYAGTEHPGTPAQPFLRPAWDAAQDEAVADLGRALWREIQSQAKAGGSLPRLGKTGPVKKG